MTKKEALNKIEELKKYIDKCDDDWIKIDYSVVPKELFDKYGIKPFEIMKRKMRENGRVINNITYKHAIEKCDALGYRLPDIKEMLMLCEFYKQENYKISCHKISCHDKEFLGIEELSYDEDVCYEFVYFLPDVVFVRGGSWSITAGPGAFALYLSYTAGDSNYGIGFRCAR